MRKRNLLVRVIIIAIITLAAIYAVFMPYKLRVDGTAITTGGIVGKIAEIKDKTVVISRDNNPNLEADRAAVFRIPTASDFTREGINATLAENIRLGLDLKGGSHLVMRVKTDKYLAKLTGDNGDAALAAAQEAKLPATNVNKITDASGQNYQVVLDTSDAAKHNEIAEAVKKKVNFADWTQTENGNQIIWTLPQNVQQAIARQAVEQAQSIISNRINTLGVTEPTLQTMGGVNSSQLLLQMPGLQDPERAKRIIGAESRLELMHVISPKNPAPMQVYPTEEAARASFGGAVPANRRILPYVERDDSSTANTQNQPQEQQVRGYVVVESPAIVDGSELREAQAISRTGGSDYQISFSLKPSGAQKFGEWTGRNIGEYMAVVLNDKVTSAPFIKSQIFDQGSIDGRFTKESGEDLALTLRSGALPTEIEYLEERTVTASLGADSIRAGISASIAGVIFVMLFMVFYYRGSGINAVVALILNMLLTLAGLVAIGATLTLPGIAGLILGIGMAVDSNVLIFERIREELKAGKDVLSAVDLGFDRAFVTIIDTHITTIISSLLLYMFGGAGPIRGFAVTLILGLLINLFTAVFVSRTIFIWLFRNRRQVEKLSI